MDDEDDDPDEVQHDDGDDFPPPGRNFPGRFLPAGELFSLCGFRPVEAAEYFVDEPPKCVGLQVRYRRRGSIRGGQGHHARPRCAPSWLRPRVEWVPRGPSYPPLLASSVIWRYKNFHESSVEFRVPQICWLDDAFSS